MQKIILASESPRRKELLAQLGLAFEIMPSGIDENKITDGKLLPAGLVEMLSDAKATDISSRVDNDAVIIAADTVVYLNGEIMGKPQDEQSAFDMLKKLQGKSHYVYTGVTIIKKSADTIIKKQFVESTAVTMATLSDWEIQDYIDTKEPFDKAGAYAIQGKGVFLIKYIKGDYNTVVGLPLFRLYHVLKELGINLSQERL